MKFYATLFEQQPKLHVPGMTEFELGNGVVLGLMPNDGIAKIVTPILPNPAEGRGIPRCELYLYVSDLDEVYQRLHQQSIKWVSELQGRNWGDRACYFSDPDGHVIALAEKVS